MVVRYRVSTKSLRGWQSSKKKAIVVIIGNENDSQTYIQIVQGKGTVYKRQKNND